MPTAAGVGSGNSLQNSQSASASATFGSNTSGINAAPTYPDFTYPWAKSAGSGSVASGGLVNWLLPLFAVGVVVYLVARKK
jgi:hypothetical protein